jgi:deoxyribodipyrimidine photolyase-related protein
MAELTLILPHQLFQEHPALEAGREVILVEEPLFFTQFPFHVQHLQYQRATMQAYRDWLHVQGFQVDYVEFHEPESDLRQLIPRLAAGGCRHIYAADPEDDWLLDRLQKGTRCAGMELTLLENPQFLNSREDLEAWFPGRKKYFQTAFYIQQRKRLGLLLDSDGGPAGGKWSFDTENRKRYPRGLKPPAPAMPAPGPWITEARAYVQKNFPNNPGAAEGAIRYPVTFLESEAWLEDFIRHRLADFGPYEDAMVCNEVILHHSILSPMLNSGLLTPARVLQSVLEYPARTEIPPASLEGFIRQLTGWREFIRGMYRYEGRRQRTTNFWGFTRKIPPSFWDGSTGIEPVDTVIRRILDTGYCHHIERLMVLGNFMLLCEFDPDEVYAWFMAMFVDAYDWVMVPNVYGMSQFADGGLMTTKPYLSGSNYLMKMGDFRPGPWQDVWDGLFWRFLHVHRAVFAGNPRWSMLLRTWENMDAVKRATRLQEAERWFQALDA